jgi:hypothetical protein
MRPIEREELGEVNEDLVYHVCVMIGDEGELLIRFLDGPLKEMVAESEFWYRG